MRMSYAGPNLCMAQEMQITFLRRPSGSMVGGRHSSSPVGGRRSSGARDSQGHGPMAKKLLKTRGPKSGGAGEPWYSVLFCLGVLPRPEGLDSRVDSFRGGSWEHVS